MEIKLKNLQQLQLNKIDKIAKWKYNRNVVKKFTLNKIDNDMKNMAKIWKKILLAVLIIACLFDVTSKIVKRYSLKEELESSATYLEQRKNNEQK